MLYAAINTVDPARDTLPSFSTAEEVDDKGMSWWVDCSEVLSCESPLLLFPRNFFSLGFHEIFFHDHLPIHSSPLPFYFKPSISFPSSYLPISFLLPSSVLPQAFTTSPPHVMSVSPYILFPFTSPSPRLSISSANFFQYPSPYPLIFHRSSSVISILPSPFHYFFLLSSPLPVPSFPRFPSPKVISLPCQRFLCLLFSSSSHSLFSLVFTMWLPVPRSYFPSLSLFQAPPYQSFPLNVGHVS